MECMEGFFRGRTAKQIACDLSLSQRTVEEHFKNMRDKLHCHTTSELAEIVVCSKFFSMVDFKYYHYEEKQQALEQNHKAMCC